MTVLLWAFAIVLTAVGVAGIVLPALPGHVLIFGGLLLAAWAEGFTRVGLGTMVLIGVLAALSYLVDLGAAALGARRGGASRRAVAGAGVGTLLGLPFGIVGVIIGPFVGAVLAELTAHRDLAKAGRVGVAAWIGFIIGTAVKIAIAFSMIAIFLVALFLV